MALNKELTDQWARVNDGPFRPTNNVDRAGLFLLAAVTVGSTAYTRIADHSGLDRAEAWSFAATARKNGIFKAGKFQGDWLDEESGGIAFVMDALVIAGLMERA